MMGINRFLIFLLLSGVCYLPATAIGLEGDIIYIDGKKWQLMAKPIATDAVVYNRLMDFLPEGRSMTTANWEGYTGFWIIKNGCLYLQKIEVDFYDEEKLEDYTLTFDADTLKAVFAPYYTVHGISTGWCSGEFRAGRGKVIRYVHSGFNRDMEEECVLTIKKGKILGEKVWHNFKNKGFSLENLQPELMKRFPFRKFPGAKGQRLMFIVNGFYVLPDGRLKDCKVVVHLRANEEEIKDQDHPLIKTFKETLKSIYPYEVFYIQGKCTLEGESVCLTLQHKAG